MYTCVLCPLPESGAGCVPGHRPPPLCRSGRTQVLHLHGRLRLCHATANVVRFKAPVTVYSRQLLGRQLPYTLLQDTPMPIGNEQTISAPHMHAACLDLLADQLQPGASALDVGSGSGCRLLIRTSPRPACIHWLLPRGAACSSCCA